MREEKLPWDLIQEILARVPQKSLVRFRTVCKRWNSLFNYKRFLNNHKNTFQFVLTTNSRIYSVSVTINLEIVVRELTSDIPGLEEFHFPRDLVNCNEFLICGYSVCNPWLRQSRLIESGLDILGMRLEGVGYDKKKNYKIIANFRLKEDYSKLLWKIYDLASDTWKDCGSFTGKITWGLKTGGFKLVDESVSLNGTLYWLASSLCMTNEDNLLIVCFHFPREKFDAFCELPCVKNHCRDALVLGGFKGDRFSLLKQCFATKKIEIWVTKNKISWDRGKDVVWMSFMQVSIPNFPDLVEIGLYDLQMQPSYFIDNDKRLVVCSWDATGRASIYVVAENTLISRTRLDSVVDLWPSHCTYVPSLVSVPPLV